jgi:hypothetical protein
MSARASALPRADFLRAPLLAAARAEGFKEWHHYLIHRPGWRLLINFSLTSQPLRDRPPRLVPRVIVLAHEQRWTGAVQRFDEAELDVSADLGTLAVGGNRMSVGVDGYRLVIDLPDPAVRGELHLTPVSQPFVVNNQPVAAGRVSWLFVPRLRADGWIRLGRREQRLDGDLAYHDHNWGRFHWGDDFGWTWGSILPDSRGDPWSLVFARMTDGRRLRALSQALYVWHGEERAAIFRHAEVRVRSSGPLRRAADCTLPPAMRLVLGGEASDVPAEVEISATRSGGWVNAEFRTRSHARLAQPSEVRLDRSVVLSESTGTARVRGAIDGRHLDLVGAGVFEVLHG